MTFSENGQEWFGTIRPDILSGLVVALALIPEAIAFSLIASVDPKVGLYASFSIAAITAFVGGRPGMISAATAATTVLLSGLFLAGKIAQTARLSSELAERVRTYRIEGQILNGSTGVVLRAFVFRDSVTRAVIDVSRAQIWDFSSVRALDMAVAKFRRCGALVAIVGMNTASERLMDGMQAH